MPNTVFRLALAMACGAALAACGKPAAGPSPSETLTPAEKAAAAYAAPPSLTSAEHSAAGGVELRGVSRPDAQVKLAGVGGTFSTMADHAGAWELRAPSVDPQIYALAADLSGRIVRSRGYVVILPAPGIAAVILRPGTGAVAPGGPRGEPAITAIDYDRGGAGVVSGRAGPDKLVRIQIDGQDAGEGRTDRTGAFSISLSNVLKPGAHNVAVRVINDQGVGEVAQAAFDVGPAAFTPPLSAQRTEQGWRLDWATPGGGVQTTLLFDTEPRA